MSALSTENYLSWGVYIASAIIVLWALYPSYSSILNLSKEEKELSILEGVSNILNNLAPGESVLVLIPNDSQVLLLNGTHIVASVNNSQYAMKLKFLTVEYVLLPGRKYLASNTGGVVSFDRA